MSIGPGSPMPPELLARFELFASVAPEARAVIARAFVREDFPQGAVVFTEGEPGDKLYLVAEGKIRISQKLGGKEEALAVLGPGHFFGDMSLIDAHPRSADAIAHEDSVLYSMDRSVFITILKLHGDLAVDVLFQFLNSLCRRLRENNERIRAMNLMAMW